MNRYYTGEFIDVVINDYVDDNDSDDDDDDTMIVKVKVMI
jgi:hypothetical protein